MMLDTFGDGIAHTSIGTGRIFPRAHILHIDYAVPTKVVRIGPGLVPSATFVKKGEAPKGLGFGLVVDFGYLNG